MTWTPPPNAERLPLTYHVGYSSEFTVLMSASTTELSLILTDLHPFDEYTVTVEAENNGGRGEPVVKKATTLSTGMCFLGAQAAPILFSFRLPVCNARPIYIYIYIYVYIIYNIII